MPSARLDQRTGTWIANFRGVYQVKGQSRNVRCPRGMIDSPFQARAYAAECERYCRIVEGVPTMADVDHAEDIRAITSDQAQALREAKAMPPRARQDLKPWTIQAAAEAHPSTQHEKTARPADYRKHLSQLTAYGAFSGSDLLVDVTLETATRWVAHLRQLGRAWDTRRHALLYLRRATQMAASVAGMPDVLAGLRLDRQEQVREVETWQMADLLRAAQKLRASRLRCDRRAPGVIALGACLGLRPSEICRLHVGDLDGDVLRIAVRQAKNRASRRDVPVPAAVLPWIADLAHEAGNGLRRPSDQPLVKTRRQSHLHDHSLDDWWATYVRPHLPAKHLTPKHLRKTFATWAIEHGIETRHVEAYLGHARSEVAAVTDRHYLAAARVAALRPAAARISELLAPLISGPGKQRKRTVKNVQSA